MFLIVIDKIFFIIVQNSVMISQCLTLFQHIFYFVVVEFSMSNTFHVAHCWCDVWLVDVRRVCRYVTLALVLFWIRKMLSLLDLCQYLSHQSVARLFYSLLLCSFFVDGSDLKNGDLQNSNHKISITIIAIARNSDHYNSGSSILIDVRKS